MSAGFGQAGSTSTTPGRIQKFKQALAQLDLTSNQKQQIKQIFSTAKSKMDAAKSSTTGKMQSRGVMKDAVEKIIAVLKPAQRAKLKQLMQASRTSR